jgi:two-component system NarL family response regulator
MGAPAKTAKIRLMLVDDHFVVRAGLAGSLALEPDIEIVAECGSGEQAIAVFRECQPDIVLMDWRLAGISGVEATAAIRREWPEAKIVSFTVYEGEEDIARAVDAGVVGYLPKSSSRQEILAALRAVRRGGTAFPPAIAAKLGSAQTRGKLTEKEMAVLRGILRGRSNKEIAGELELAEVTVKFYVGRILEKLGVLDRTQAATAALQRGLIHLD